MNELENHTDPPMAAQPSSSPPPPDFSAASQPAYVRTLFLGPDGLRAGWGFVFYLLMFYELRGLASAWVVTLHLGDLWPMMIWEFLAFLAAVIPAFILARVERRSWSAYGLPGRQAFGKFFWVGGLWGFAAVTALLGSLYGLRVFDFGHLALHGPRAAKFAAFWALMFLLVGFLEEFLMRGYTQFTLTRGIGFWPSAVFLSAAFGYIHHGNEGEQWRGLLAAAAIGFFFCLTLRRTGNLWFAVGFHAAWDWGETFFYSVPDSGTLFPGHLLSSSLHGNPWLTGGTVGPEGSALCFVVIGLLWILFDRVYPDVKYSPD
jgi:uncharacterized protein